MKLVVVSTFAFKFRHKIKLFSFVFTGKSTLVNFLTNFFKGNTRFDCIVENPKELKIAIPCKNWIENVQHEYLSSTSELNINDSTVSQTSKCCIYKFKENNKNIQFKFIDTPGFNDTKSVSNDKKHLESIRDICISESNLNSIIVTINGTNLRLTLTAKALFDNLKRYFPNTLMQNIIIVFTNCDENSRNFDLSLLKDLVPYKKYYTMQNSIFK